MFKLFRRPLRASVGVRGISSHRLRAPGAHTLVGTVARAPCLQCGRSSGLPHSADISQVLATRVDCGASLLPLACSKECAAQLEKTQPQLLKVFDSMVEDVEFAATPQASQLFAEVLQPSRRDASKWEGDRHMTSWAEYLLLFSPSDRWMEDVRALRLLSSAYSYVLTLSRFLPELLSNQAQQKLELHVIGARAEAMMPRYLWDELSFFHPDKQFTIKLVGDHVPVLPKRMQSTGSSDDSAIQLENITGLYHKLKPGKVGIPDAFVLYNPGVGHPHLRESWRPTMETVLASRKPVLLTSFSVEDQQRDVAALQELVASSPDLNQYELRFLCRAKQNSFRSLKYQVDPASGMPIQTNNRVMVVQLAAAGNEQATS